MIRDKYSEGEVLAIVSDEFLGPFSPQNFDEEMSAIHGKIREKAVEFSNEKSVCIERINHMASLVTKQLKAI